MTKIYELLIDKKIYDMRNIIFPKDILEVKDENERLKQKIWYIKVKIRNKIYCNNKVKPILNSYKHPDGLCILDRPISLNAIDLDNAFNELEKLVRMVLNRNTRPDDISIYNQLGNKDRSVLYIFASNKINYNMTYNEVIKLLKKYKYIDLLHVIKMYGEYIIKTYGISRRNFYKNCIFCILKYSQDAGMWTHIDNIARYDQGPIITVSIGPNKIYYDMIPIVLEDIDNKNVKPLRLEINNGDMVIMDSSSRIEWAHGLPYKCKYEKTKYTLLFKNSKFKGNTVVSRNKVIDIDVISSGKVC